MLREERIQRRVVGNGLGCLGGVCDFGEERAEDGEAGFVFGAHGGFELGLEGGEEGGGVGGEGAGGEEGAVEKGEAEGGGGAGEAEERHVGGW